MPSPGSKNDTPGIRALPLLWRQLLDVLVQRFSSQKTEKRDRFVLLFLTTVILTLSISPQQDAPSRHYLVGEVVGSDVRAGRDYLIEDKKLTAEKQSEAVSKIPLVYEFNENLHEDLTSRIRKGFTLLENTNRKRLESDRESIRKEFSEFLGLDVTPSELMAFSKIKSDTQFLHDIEHSLQNVYKTPVVANTESFLSDQLSGISIYRIDGTKLPDTLPSDHIDIEYSRRQLLGRRFVSSDSAAASASVKAVISRMLKPSLTYNRDKTEEMKALARGAVSPVLIQIKRGEMIARDGDRITPAQEMKLSAIASETSWLGHVATGAGLMGIVLVLLYFPYRFALKNIRKFRPSNKDILLLLILTVGHFLLLRTLFSITPYLSGAFHSIDTSDYLFLFPFAATAIMVRIFVNSEVAFVYAAITAPLAGLLYGSLPIVFYSMIGSIIGAHGVRHCDSRSTIFTAGLKVSVVNVAIALSFQLFNQSLLSVQTVYILVFSFMGGIASSVLASGAIPLLENLFQYTTDIKLIELTNLNSPILRELMIKAPGTYHHSVVVGNLVEAAAEAINANPLLARVAAYYHDIGKISKAQYFIENQSGGENRHDKLTPSMSALILITHVKEGAELARQHKLGQPISEIIRQSHGTGLIKYFYQKALEQALPGQEISEHDFRYHGPKPQTREAGLVLLADNVEAASRTLVEASPARIQGLVQKIINNIFIDGQLDECELTLKNLHQIAWSFNQILAGIYHHRIDYPQPAYKEKGSGGKKDVEQHSDNEPSKTDEDRGEEVKGSSSEDLKRLGMYF
jgi:cyclic-di-AMP phosphodiesterase PgpH